MIDAGSAYVRYPVIMALICFTFSVTESYSPGAIRGWLDFVCVVDLRHCESAIERERLAGSPRRVATEPENGGCDFFRRTAAAHRVHALDVVRQVRVFTDETLVHLGVNSARTNRVYAHA